MEIKVTQNEVKINKDILNDGEYNIHKCQFDFDEEYNGLVQKAVFSLNDGTSYLETIVNNECNIPIEVLEEGVLKIGVYAYETNNDELVLRYSPSPDIIHVFDGSYVKDAQNSEGGTPTEYEQLESRVNTALNEIDEALADVETAVNEANNLDVDVSKTGKVATIDVTKKNGTVKTVTLSDGTSLQFKWEGTSLGIKTDNEEIYTYVDLEGPQGKQGIQGPQGEEGKTGPQGETGATGNGILSIQKTATAGLVDTYTITFTDGTTTTFDVTNGEDGEVTQAQLDESQAKQDTKIDWLQTLVNQMPTVSGQGTDLSLQDVLNYRLMKFLPQGVSSQDGEPTPTTPVPVKSVTGENSVKVQNRNLFDNVNEITANIGLTSGGGTFSSTDYCIKNWLKLKPNTNYVLSDDDNTKTKRICFYTSKSESSFISVVEQINKTVSFTTPANCKYVRIQIKQTELNNEMLVKGSTAPSTYVEHEEQNYQLSLGNIELNSSPDGTIRDGIVGSPNNWYKREYIKKVTITSDDVRGVSNTYSDLIYYSIPKTSDCISYNSYTEDNAILGNKFIATNMYYFSDSRNIGKLLSKAHKTEYWIGFDIGTTLEQAKELLNNAYYYYVTTNPIDIPITDTTLISQLNDIYNNAHSYNGVTNITTTYEDGNEQMYLDIEALKNVWEVTE